MMVKLLDSSKEPTGPCCCIYKGKSKHCTTFSENNKKILSEEELKYSVHSLTRVGGRGSKEKLCELIDSGIYDILNIPDGVKFGPKITKQIKVHKSGKADINYEAIKTELDTLQFPLYFLDYESFNPAIRVFQDINRTNRYLFNFLYIDLIHQILNLPMKNFSTQELKTHLLYSSRRLKK